MYLGTSHEQHEPRNTKVLLRKAMAYEQLGEFEKAMQDVQAALELPLPAPLQQTAIAMKNRLAPFIARDRLARIADPVPETFVTKTQTLRLYLRNYLDTVCIIGVPFTVNLAIVNEFGLWSHAILRADQAVSLNLELLSLDAHRGMHTSTNLRARAIEPLMIGQLGKLDCTVIIEHTEQVCDPICAPG